MKVRENAKEMSLAVKGWVCSKSSCALKRSASEWVFFFNLQVALQGGRVQRVVWRGRGAEGPVLRAGRRGGRGGPERDGVLGGSQT